MRRLTLSGSPWRARPIHARPSQSAFSGSTPALSRSLDSRQPRASGRMALPPAPPARSIHTSPS
ncbi:hypothetical protein, partial [Rothia nasimurium]|uniref:hypothetical protein n=1 Tax=Rothia nasimurium TaxID=85336 RepID=UPI001F24BF61